MTGLDVLLPRGGVCAVSAMREHPIGRKFLLA